MDYSTGKLSFILMLAVLLSFLAAWVVARRYRAAMRRLMSAPLAASMAGAAPVAASASAVPASSADLAGQRTALLEPAPVTASDNRRAGRRLALLLLALSALISITSAALQLHVVMSERFSVNKLLVLGLVQLWPVIPCLGLMWRWSRLRVLGALLLWLPLCLALLVWRTQNAEPEALLGYLAFEVGPPMLVAGAVCLGGATRAVAPWLLLPMIGLVWASQTGLDLIALMIPDPPRWFLALSGALGAYTVMALFVLLPWLLAWWPLKQLARVLAHAYARKSLSELMVLFTAVWAISQTTKALMAASDIGLGGLVMFVPLAWVPVAMALNRLVGLPGLRGALGRAGRPPTLLVLRVFQQDERVQALFDHVIERWRLTGNTVLIAGTDLVERTLDAEELFMFIDGRLHTRFIHGAADLAARVAAFDLRPDADGRYRINECLCHDTTWQQALSALVQRSDVVLMDLRSFKRHNLGCRHELAELARAERIRRVVVLTDADTDQAAARDAAAGAPAGRFVWLDTTRVGRAKRTEVLHSLFLASGDAGSPRAVATQAAS